MTAKCNSNAVWLVVVVLMLGALGASTGCKPSVSITLCSTANEPIEFVVRFTRAEPATLTGIAAAHGRTTISAKPLGDGHYSIELHRGTKVRIYELGYTTTDGGEETYTINDALDLTEGCAQ